MVMIHFTTTFNLALMIGMMEVIQLTVARILLDINTFQRRQIGGIPAQIPPCAPNCDPVTNILAPGSCSPSQCCSSSFETLYFNCFACISGVLDLTDYTQPQSYIDEFYDQCASLGFQLPVLTFPGQNPNRALSSVVQFPSSQTTDSIIIPTSFIQTSTGPLTSPATTATSSEVTTTTSTSISIPTTSPSSAIKTAQKSCFNLIAGVMILGTSVYFVVR